ncbi:hypothetical protein, partial [Collinsella aerofaciens]|uniref:hypothetical protein n=1 Tax=Collinsella aerofaciens TaxID=74426 RepID=UPI003D657CD2
YRLGRRSKPSRDGPADPDVHQFVGWPKNDMIIFDRRKCLEYTQYKSDKAIYKGLAELVQSEIIARGPNEYNWFINPLIVFNGDRVSFTKTYVRKKTLAAQKKEEAEKRQLSLGFDEL